MSQIKSYDFSLLDDVLRAEDYAEPLNWESIFQNNNKLIVEAGCGNGHFLNQAALNDSLSNYIGIDINSKRLIRCREKQAKINTANIKWIWGDAISSLKNLFGLSTISLLLMPFPDPWPKLKHHRRRLFNKDFIETMHNKLADKGIFILITDFFDYHEAGFSLIKNDDRFEISTDNNSIGIDLSNSFFGNKWKKENRKLYTIKLEKKPV